MQDQIPTSLPTTGSDAAALSQMGFSHMIQHLDVVGWILLITLVVLSLMSWFYIISNAVRNRAVRAPADKVIAGFWGLNATQEAIQFMEAQPKDEPFSKVALEGGRAAAHHAQEGRGI